MSITIRPITVSDKARWLELFREYIVFYKSKVSDEQLELTWQRIHSDFNINGLLAEKDGEVVGNVKTVAGGISWKYPEELVT